MDSSPQLRHLPYQIDPEKDRFHYYETLWKRVGLDLLKKYMPAAGQTVLDYGSGRGEAMQLLGEAGYRVTGTDIDPQCVGLSGRYGPSLLLDPENPVYQFGHGSFDAVTCFHVLEHVDSPKKTLKQLAQIARKYVVIAVPNLRYLHSLLNRDIQLSVVNEGHLQSWDHWHLRNLAERHCGLRLVEWGFDATLMPFLSRWCSQLAGVKATIWLETGLFRAMFPFHGLSVIGLFEVKCAGT